MDPSTTKAFKEAREEWMRAYFEALYSATGGNISEIARRAQMGRSHVRFYLDRFALRAAA